MTKSNAQRFTELTGLELPDNFNAADILKIMMAREDWYVENWKEPQGFCWEIGTRDCGTGPFLIYLTYILNPSALLERAIEFLEGK